MLEVYTKKQLREGLWNIMECHRPDGDMSVHMYLVEGEERAALIDTGFGVVDHLRTVVESITKKPIVCIAAHGHPDHAGAASLFDDIYMNSRDEDLLAGSLSYERRMGDVFGREGYDPELKPYCEKHIVMTEKLNYKNIDQGDVVDLGGKKLEVYAIPGHTQGSVALLNRADNYALISDAFSRRTALSTLPPEKRVGLTAYRDGLARFADAIEEDTLLYWGHSNVPVDHAILKDMLQACNEVLDGKTENDTESINRFAKRKSASNKRMMEHRCGRVCLAYDANTL
ncbi:MAG: MBL fold metallo-hydrolase [Lachnospiraceae bacterium]|nr:MBL fold metallo-hydrolase [Lachnospiraceae bacterium]